MISIAYFLSQAKSQIFYSRLLWNMKLYEKYSLMKY